MPVPRRGVTRWRLRDTFLSDDGKIDAKEARVLLGEAVSSGRTLTQDEVATLRGVMDDQRTDEASRTELNDVLQYVGDPAASVGQVVKDTVAAVAAAVQKEQ